MSAGRSTLLCEFELERCQHLPGAAQRRELVGPALLLHERGECALARIPELGLRPERGDLAGRHAGQSPRPVLGEWQDPSRPCERVGELSAEPEQLASERHAGRIERAIALLEPGRDLDIGGRDLGRRIGRVVEDRQHELSGIDQSGGGTVAGRHDRLDRESLAEVGQSRHHPAPDVLGIAARIGVAATHLVGRRAYRQDAALR